MCFSVLVAGTILPSQGQSVPLGITVVPATGWSWPRSLQSTLRVKLGLTVGRTCGARETCCHLGKSKRFRLPPGNSQAQSTSTAITPKHEFLTLVTVTAAWKKERFLLSSQVQSCLLAIGFHHRRVSLVN